MALAVLGRVGERRDVRAVGVADEVDVPVVLERRADPGERARDQRGRRCQLGTQRQDVVAGVLAARGPADLGLRARIQLGDLGR